MKIENIRRALQTSSLTHHSDEQPEFGRIGAVTVLLYQNRESNSVRFVLTRRSDDLKDHPGQISLPGGRRETGESLASAAIRESVEEIGVEENAIEILAALDSVYIPPSDFTIFPFVAWYHQNPVFQVQQAEVAEVIEADVNWLCSPNSLRFGLVRPTETSPEQRPIQSNYFEIEGRQVWGATCRVLIDFRSRLMRPEVGNSAIP